MAPGMARSSRGPAPCDAGTMGAGSLRALPEGGGRAVARCGAAGGRLPARRPGARRQLVAPDADAPHFSPRSAVDLGDGAGTERASVLVRLHRETGEERYAEGALRALRPFAKAQAQGGVRAELHGGPFFEEYPTTRPSFVLNGGNSPSGAPTTSASRSAMRPRPRTSRRDSMRSRAAFTSGTRAAGRCMTSIRCYRSATSPARLPPAAHPSARGDGADSAEGRARPNPAAIP